MIGASGSLLIARIRFAALQPTMCWIAPLMPQAMYRSGAIRIPVWPTCSECGRQPAIVTTREHADGAAEQVRQLLERSRSPRRCRRPAPPPTTTRASASETLSLRRRDPTGDAGPAGRRRSSVGVNGTIAGAAPPAARLGGPRRAWAATVSRAARSPSSQASSSRLPAQRWRVTPPAVARLGRR